LLLCIIVQNAVIIKIFVTNVILLNYYYSALVEFCFALALRYIVALLSYVFIVYAYNLTIKMAEWSNSFALLLISEI